MNSITDKRPKGSNGIFNEQNLADTEVMDEPKGNSSKKSSSDSNLFTENNLKKKDGGDESKSNPQSSSQNNSGVPMVGNPDFQEPTNFTTGNNVFPTDSKSMLNIPLGNTNNNPVVPATKFTPNLSNGFQLKSATQLAQENQPIKDNTQLSMLPLFNRKNVLGQDSGNISDGNDEGVQLATNYHNAQKALTMQKSSFQSQIQNNYQDKNVQQGDMVKPQLFTPLPVDNTNQVVNGLDDQINSINQKEQELKTKTIQQAGAYANKIGANATNAGLITRAILGDKNAIQQATFLKKGDPVAPSDMFYNDQQGLDAMSKGLDAQYANDLTNPDYLAKKKNIDNQQAVLIDKYPEFKQQQIATIVAQQIMKDNPNASGMMLLPGLKAAKELGLSDADIKNIDFDNLPIQSPLSNAVGAIYNGIINIGAGAARVLGSAVGMDQDYLTSHLQQATKDAQQRFADVSGLENAPTVVDADKTSPTYLQNIANPDKGKYNYNFHTISNAIGNGIGGLVQFVGGTKLIGGVASKVIPALTEQASTEAGMAGLMIGQSYEPNYEKALTLISDKPEDEWKRHAYSLINGSLDYYAFRGLGKVVQDLDPKITEDIAGVFKEASSLGQLKTNQLTKAVTKAIDGLKQTVGETAFVGTAQASSEVAKNIVDNVMGNQKGADQSNKELGNVLLNGVQNLPFAIAIPVGASKLISGIRGSYLSRENIYNAGLNPETYLGQASKLKDEGIITPEDYSKRAQVINTAAKVVSSIPDDLNLNHNQKVAYTNSKLRELALKSQAENVDDAALEKFYNDKIAEEVNNRTDIINGGSKEPFYTENNSSQSQTNTNGKSKESVPENVNETIRGEQTGQQSGQENVDQNQQQKEKVGTGGADQKTAPSTTVGLSHGDWLDRNKDLFTLEKYEQLNNDLNSDNENVKQKAVDDIVAKKEEQKDEVGSLSDQVKPFTDEIKQPIYKKIFESGDENDINDALKEVAQQANGSDAEKKGAINTFGENIVKIAQDKFPDEKVATNQEGELANFEKQNSTPTTESKPSIESNEVETTDYRGEHQIVSPITTADNLEGGGSGFEWKFSAQDWEGKHYKESLAALKGIKDNPDAEVTIYRAVPKGVKNINEGDWVSLSKTYAKEHGMHETDAKKDMPVISKKVKAKDIGWDGNDLNEFVYNPETKKSNEVEGNSALKEGFTESSDLNRMYANLKTKYGEREGKKLYEAAERLVNPNKNTIVEIRPAGVVVREGEKHLLKPFGNTDANVKKWNLYKDIDISDQFNKPNTNETKATTGTKEAIQPEPEKTEPKPTEVKSEQLKPESKTEPEVKQGKFEAKARKIVEDLGKKADKIPSWLINKDTNIKGAGLDNNALFKMLGDATIEVGKLLDKGMDFAEAIKRGADKLIDDYKNAFFTDEAKKDNAKLKPEFENQLRQGFEQHYRDNIGEPEKIKSEDNSGQKPPPETPKNENEGKEENEGIGISKAALNESHGFKRIFESKSAKEVADNVFSELQSEAKDKGIKVNQHIANEVDDMAAQGSKLAPTEYNIITAGTHSMNIDRQIDEAQAKGESVESLIKERDKTDAVLRQLGNNAGRNLGLFNLVFNDITDSGINVARRNLSKVLGIEDIPQTLEDLKNSDLSSFDKKRAYPYVERIEKLIKERDDYEKKSIQNISKINDEEVQKAIKDAYDKGKKEGTSRGTDKPAKEKKSQQLKDMASLLRRSDEMDKFLKGNNDITKAGFGLGSYKEVIANILDGVAKIVETGENISDYLKKAIENVKGFDKDKLLSDIQTIMARSSMPKREDVIADINKIAENESATSITKSMVDKGLIKNVVDDIALSGTPSEKVIDEATGELKKHLPNVTRDDVADAYVKRNEFAPETKNKLKNTVVEKQQEIKRLSVKEARLEALEKADDFHAAETKEDKSKIKSEYEKNLDKRISDLKKQKSDAIAANKKSAKEQKKIDDINDEINHVNNTKSVFERAIKSPKQASEDLKAARLERDKTYEKNGLRIQRNERQPIKVEREYQKNVDKINSDNSLSTEEKNNKLDELKQQRDLDLRGTKQGVLSHLSDELNDLKNKNIKDANDATDEHASQLRDINSKIDNILKGIKPTGENLDDLTNKAYDKLGKLLDDKTVPDDIKEQIRTITKNLEDNAQLTANELAAKTLKNRWQKDIDRANTKLNSGNFTELPITPFDFRRNNELAVLNRKRETTQKGVNNLIREAYDKKRTKADRLMDLSSKLLISGVHTVTKVAEAGALKPVMDSIVEATTGRIFNKLTDTPEVTFKEIKRGFKTLAAFKNKESANRYIEKLKGVKETSLGNLQKAYEGGDKNEISKAEIAFKKADLSYAISTLYESIDANSLKSFWEYMAHGATDLDAEMGKGLRKSISDYHTKLEKAGYVLEGWIRTHGALKASLSARNEMMRSYASTLKWMQKKGMPLNEENLALAHVIAQNDFEYGRLSNQTEFSKTVSEFKNSNKLGVRLAARTLFPVSTIAINIAKRGIDYSSLGAEGWGKLARGIKEGIKLNETEGKTYDTFIDKIKDGIQQIPLQERKYINGVISRGLFGAALGAVTLWGLANGKIKYGGTWDDRKKRKVIGSDGQVLQPNEWEFFGWKAPKMMDAFINHVPEFLPIALTADYYQINTLDKDGVGANFFDTAMGEIEDRMPFMTLANIFNNPTSTLEDRFTRVPIAQDVEKEFDSKKRANKTFGEKLKNNVGLGFLNPERQDMPSGFPDAIKKDYERTTDVGFLPPKIESRIIYKGHQIDLNNKQYQDFANMVNEGRTKAATAITNDPDYNKASDEQRKKMLRSGYDYARKIAKYQFLNKYPGLRNSVEQKISNQNKVSQQQRELRAGGSGAQSNY